MQSNTQKQKLNKKKNDNPTTTTILVRKHSFKLLFFTDLTKSITVNPISIERHATPTGIKKKKIKLNHKMRSPHLIGDKWTKTIIIVITITINFPFFSLSDSNPENIKMLVSERHPFPSYYQ